MPPARTRKKTAAFSRLVDTLAAANAREHGEGADDKEHFPPL